MRLSLLLFSILIVSNLSCKRTQECSKGLGFQDAVTIAVDHLAASGSYSSFYRVIDDPNNSFWDEYVSNAPDMLDAYGLNNIEYYAIIFYTEGVRDGGATVFVDKKEKRVIGALYDHERFEKNEMGI